MKANVNSALNNVEQLEEMEVKAERMEDQAKLYVNKHATTHAHSPRGLCARLSRATGWESGLPSVRCGVRAPATTGRCGGCSRRSFLFALCVAVCSVCLSHCSSPFLLLQLRAPQWQRAVADALPLPQADGDPGSGRRCTARIPHLLHLQPDAHGGLAGRARARAHTDTHADADTHAHADALAVATATHPNPRMSPEPMLISSRFFFQKSPSPSFFFLFSVLFASGPPVSRLFRPAPIFFFCSCSARVIR